MLPIRLGTVNANGPQELFIYTLTKKRPRRDDELPHGEAAERHASCRRTSRMTSRASTARCSEQQVRREVDVDQCFRQYMGHGVVTIQCAADPTVSGRAEDAGRVLGRRRRARGTERCSSRACTSATTRSTSRRSAIVPADRRSRELPGAVCVAARAWTGGDTCPAATEYKRTLAERRRKGSADVVIHSPAGGLKRSGNRPHCRDTRRRASEDVGMVEGGSEVGTKDEGRGTKDEGRRTKGEGRRAKDEGAKEEVQRCRRFHRP